jgi:predicted AlkP superfamily pyrophosphatase or phosphodiesterase
MTAKAMIPFATLVVMAGAAGAPARRAPDRPRLIVMLTVDQMRADYLVRWRGQLTGGLGTLLASGAVFTNAYQDHAVTETAPGHSTVLSGRWPAHTRILTNSLGVGDPASPLLEVSGPGASPARFRGTALFDWLQAAEPASRALSVSRKDRGAILPIGSARQQVYWYQSGKFTTSRYYRDSLPAWVSAFNALRLPYKTAGREIPLLLPDSAYAEPDSEPWENGGHAMTFPHRLPTDSARAAIAVAGTSLMDSLTLAFALAGVEALRLGRRGPTELLAVSLSTTDAIGHAFGPDSREIHDQVLRLDRYLGWFFDRLFSRVGRDRVLIVLTADHGVTPFPEVSRQDGHPDARWVSIDTLVHAVNLEIDQSLQAAEPHDWLELESGLLFLHDNGRLVGTGISKDSLLTEVSRRIRAVPGVARVDRPDALWDADTVADPVARRWLHELPRGTDVVLTVTLAPWDAWSPGGGFFYAMHGQPSDLDAHVPLIFWGKGIRAGAYGERANTVDIAPTLAHALGLAPLSIPDGRVLDAALTP